MTSREATRTSARELTRLRKEAGLPEPTLRSDGRFQILITYRDELDRTKRKPIYGKDREACILRAIEARVRLLTGESIQSASAPLGKYVEQWLAGPMEISGRKEHTKVNYRGMARNHIIGSSLGTVPLNRLKATHIEIWLAELRRKGLSASSIRKCWTLLAAVVRTALRDKVLTNNPMLAVEQKPKEPVSRAAYLTPAEAARLIAAARYGVEVPRKGGRGDNTGKTMLVAKTRMAPVLDFLVNSGLRRGEGLGLRWSEVDLEDGTISVVESLAQGGHVGPVKTHRSNREVVLSDNALEILREVRVEQARLKLKAGPLWQETGYVFTTERGLPLAPRNLLRAAQLAAEAAGLHHITVHSLRHTFASAMLRAGVDLKTVSTAVGHSTIAITADLYGHVSQDDMRAAMRKLPSVLDTRRAS